MYPWLEDAIERQATVITASGRLARELSRAYARKQTDAGTQAWLTPPIHSFNDWCRAQVDLHADAGSIRARVDELAVSLLWDRALKKNAPDGVLAFRGMLRLAREAWRRVCEYKVPLAGLARTARSPDEIFFATAAVDYQRAIDAGHWVDAHGMPPLLTTLVADKHLEVPRELVFAGFDRLTPAASALFDALSAAGCSVQAAPVIEMDGAVRVSCCADHDAELRTAGAWARGILEQNSTASIAIVSPALQQNSIRSARLLREGLAPGWQYGSAAHRGAVDVSYGRRLADYPAIAGALALLKWLHAGLSTQEISLLLRSRCLASDSTSGRSRLELKLRQLPDRAWMAEELRQVLAGHDDSADSQAFMRGLDSLIATRDDLPVEADPAYWASRIDALLNAWNWPCSAPLSSEDFQLVNRWRTLLNELAGIAVVQANLRLKDVTERLRFMAEDVVFQPESAAGQVALLGTLEAAGMQFDHLWVCGLHAGQWPPSGTPSPLLSHELQKEYGMPDATPDDTLEYARRVLQRLLAAAPDVVLSWPQTDEEAELTPSGLLDDIRQQTAFDAVDPAWHAAGFSGDRNLRIVHDDAAPKVTADETVRGGAYTVQRQSVEPFSAFVYGRLGVQRLEAIESGVAARVRGNIVHNALHTLLNEQPTQEEIGGWSGQDLERRLGTAVDAALSDPMRHADATYRQLLGLERRRTIALLRSYIAAEGEREPFSVQHVEHAVDFEACGVRLGLRMDRVDRLGDGSWLIIDYKTGAPRNLLNREGELTDLQLVVYAAALDAEIGGLAFVNLDSRSITYKGTGGSVEWDAARRDSWAERLAASLDEVHALLEEIATGDVRVNLALSREERRALGLLSRIEEHERAR